MKKIKLEWNHSGFRQINCSEGAKQACEEIAAGIKGRADAGLTSDDTPGYEMGGKVVRAYGSDRWMYFVHTTDAATMIAEQQDQVLSKAVK